jgi:hypothetical protein
MNNIIEFPVWKVRPSLDANPEWLDRVLRSPYTRDLGVPSVGKQTVWNSRMRKLEGDTND